MNPTPLSVLLADDHPVFLGGLLAQCATAQDMLVAAAVRTGREAVRRAAELHPDVAVLDVRMPDCDGIETTRMLRGQHPPVAVLILTGYDDDRQFEAAMAAGAHGFLSKHAEPHVILDAVRAVAHGALVFDPRLADRVRSRLRPEYGWAHAFPQLTGRERQVLSLLGERCSNHVIAQRLGLHEKTVRNHVSAVLAKLPAHDRSHAAQLAREAGLGGVPPTGPGP
ncbi:hypothetical protein ADK86_25520 [Streptomyces sp. NRRL F-5755]|uniref:response regulator transcription factor n=1 Tax=Streptomyces sp. NRRL F-5755 TaxID=1519475 RepID=UPI0006AEE039|nr:response regulator transcription factor [Streptomyces sp. NRRL F-5755]KOT90709.1 hypothetical protein ADK86_25520 [Streptomyces sp. NRRL F-5755]